MGQLLAVLIVPPVVGLLTYFVVHSSGSETKMVRSKAIPRASLKGRRSRIGHRPEQGRHVPRDGAIIFADLIGKLDVLKTSTMLWDFSLRLDRPVKCTAKPESWPKVGTTKSLRPSRRSSQNTKALTG